MHVLHPKKNERIKNDEKRETGEDECVYIVIYVYMYCVNVFLHTMKTMTDINCTTAENISTRTHHSHQLKIQNNMNRKMFAFIVIIGFLRTRFIYGTCCCVTYYKYSFCVVLLLMNTCLHNYRN